MFNMEAHVRTIPQHSSNRYTSIQCKSVYYWNEYMHKFNCILFKIFLLNSDLAPFYIYTVHIKYILI